MFKDYSNGFGITPKALDKNGCLRDSKQQKAKQFKKDQSNLT